MLKQHRNSRVEYTYYEDNGLEILHGKYFRRHDNGSIQAECTYSDGKLHGVSKHWYRCGKKWEHSFYYNGQRHGEIIVYCPEGNIIVRRFYINNKEHPYVEMNEQEKLLFQIQHPEFRFIPDER